MEKSCIQNRLIHNSKTSQIGDNEMMNSSLNVHAFMGIFLLSDRMKDDVTEVEKTDVIPFLKLYKKSNTHSQQGRL